jgi:hypothetical protein
MYSTLNGRRPADLGEQRRAPSPPHSQLEAYVLFRQGIGTSTTYKILDLASTSLSRERDPILRDLCFDLSLKNYKPITDRRDCC